MKLLLAANADPNCVCIVSIYVNLSSLKIAKPMYAVFIYVCLQDQCTLIASTKGFNDVMKSLLVVNADPNCI